ncbi:MAG TPA: patatin-like phospholipase family protein [Longimicrobiales bacterium]|nr:patatin-like phospholipase family protein [Longimicrobiales bacterium]
MPAAHARSIVVALAVMAALVGPMAMGGPAPAAAQQALVLSGGGARGLAHVGVLLRLDSLGYDPDLVVGTSMGAVIGALYAAGYEPDEIRERTTAIAWGEMFDPTAALVGPERAVRLPLLTFGLDLAQRQVSRGLFGEWRINRALAGLLFDANARARGDFDRLARRYRAIAADLGTGAVVVLDSGDLALAARASMAFPGFWAPVRWGDRLLVDGGIVDNVPTAEARRLGATSIIAVDVGRPPEEIGSLEALAVVQRALSLMQRNMHPDTIPPDVLVAPVVDGGVGAGFPDDPSPLIELGLETARREIPPPRSDGRGERPLPPAPRWLGGLRVESEDPALAALARHVFAPVAPGPYAPAAALAAVDRLYGTGLFEGVWPRVAEPDTAGGFPTLVVRLDAPAQLSASLGAGFENDRGGRAWATLDRQGGFAGRPAILSGAVSTDGLDRWAALSARIHPITRRHYAWTVGAHVRERSVRTFTEDTRSTVEVLRTGGWVGIELPHILRERVLTVTGLAEWLDPQLAPGSASYGPLLRLSSIPSQARVVGVPLLLEAEARWGDQPYRRFAVAGSLTRTGGALQVAPLLDLRGVSDLAPVDAQPALGDQHAVPGLRWGEGRGLARAVAGVDLAVPRLGGHARLRIRSGAVADRPAAWDAARWIAGAEIGGVWRLPFGLLEAGYGHATMGDGRFDVSLGRQF